MEGDDKRAARRVPVVLRIKLHYKQVDTFISKFATNISSGGMFISSRKPKPVGTDIRFQGHVAGSSQLDPLRFTVLTEVAHAVRALEDGRVLPQRADTEHVADLVDDHVPKERRRAARVDSA